MMFCFLYQWAISRSMDTRKPPGRLTRRHLARCPACRRFQDQCLALARELADDARHAAVSVSADLHAKILQRCEQIGRPGTKTSLRDQAGPASPLAWAGAGGPIRSARKLLLRPATAWAAAAAIFLLAVVGGYFYPTMAPPKTPPEIVIPGPVEPAGVLAADLPTPSEPLAALDQALGQGVEEELRLLQADGKAAAEFFLACVPWDIRVPEK